MIVETGELEQYRGRVTMVDGAFDPLHAGHLGYFRAAAELGLPVLCNVAPDSYVELKHPPLLPQEQRVAVLDAIRDIELVHLSRGATADALRALQPRYYAKGTDWVGRLPDEETRICSELGIEIVYLDTVTQSSSELLDRFRTESSRPAADPARPASVPRVGGGTTVDAVVSHHMDGFRSGVARFNELLAERLGVPRVQLFDSRAGDLERPLLSIKFSELSDRETSSLERVVRAAGWSPDVFLHEFSGSALEREVITNARRVLCGNHEILEHVRGLNENVEVLWTPGLVLDDRTFEPAEISVFTFGMAHKIRTSMFRRLRDLLEASGRTYAVYASTANHETASMRDAEVVYAEMHDVFPRRLYFMGNLSDVAVFNQLRQTTFFAAFFEGGLRANNTSVSSALERGAVVITNLDEYSPPELRHLDNVIDIQQCDELPFDPLVLKRLSVRAMETSRSRSWERLVRRLDPADQGGFAGAQS